MSKITDRLKNAWNIFSNKDPSIQRNMYRDSFTSSILRPDRVRLSRGNERSIVNSIINRIGIDIASIDIKHVKTDEDGRYKSTMDSGLNNILTLEANIDQSGRQFIQDVVMSMFDEGCIALVPVDTESPINDDGSYDINTIRTGKILEWMPRHIKVSVYNDRTGKRETVVVSKGSVAIIENPLYSVMNEPNSTLQRLKRKLNLLDYVDEQSSSGKLDLIVQLPYPVRSKTRKNDADRRRKEIEEQLTGSKYGIAYMDSTEKVTQLNRSVENNLLAQVKDLTTTLYGQLGVSEAVFNGTADEKEMLNYYNRTIEPILSTIAAEITRKFLTKTGRSQGQAIYFYRNPFSLATVNDIAELGDKFTRNEIASSNEIRSLLGWKPDLNPKSDELINSNLNQPDYADYGNDANYDETQEIDQPEQ